MDKKILMAIVVAAVVVVAVVAAAFILRPEGRTGTVYYDTSITVPNMKAALSTGLIDGFISWEPFVSEASMDDTGEVLMWSSEMMPNHPCCVVVASTNFLETEDGPDLTKRFLKAHMDATEWMLTANQDHDSAEYTLLVTLAQEFTLRNSSVVSAAMSHLEYKYEMDSSFTTALEEFTDMYIDLNITTNAAIADMGYDSVSDFADSYANETLLAEAGDIEPSSTILGTVRLGYLVGDIHQMAQFVANDPRVLDGDKSIFEKYGLEVAAAEGAPFSSGGAEMDAFVAGDVDIGYLGAPPAIVKHLNGGAKTTIVAQANIEGSGLVVAKNSGIESLDDLVNKTIAVPNVSSIQFLLLKIALEERGYDFVVKSS